MKLTESKWFVVVCICLLVLLGYRFVQMPIYDYVGEIHQFVGDTVKIIGSAEKTYIQNNQFRIILSNISVNDQYIHSSLLLLLPRNQTVTTGSQIILHGQIQAFSDITNNPFAERVIVGSVYYPTVDSVVKEVKTVRSTIDSVQTYILSKARLLLPEPHAALVVGIIFGIEAEMTEGFKNALKEVGLIHIIVASGFNALIVGSIVLRITQPLPHIMRIVIFSILMLSYVCITGFQIPILRAAIMMFGTVLAQVLGERKQGLWWLLLSAYILLIYRPQWLFSLSFQLSFAASLGIITTSFIFEKLFYFIPSIIRSDTATTFAAQLFTLPLLYIHLGSVSFLGYITNPLILWTIIPIMYIGALAFTIALFSLSLGRILLLPVWFLLDILITFTNFIYEYV